MHVSSYTPYGTEGIIVRVEVDIRRGIPGVDMSGLADGAVREARERVRAAFRNSGFAFPQDRVLVNLAPAGVRKEGASLDLPIALAILAASGQAPLSVDCLAMGELELSGRIRAVRGVLAATAAGLSNGMRGFIVPAENGQEASILASGRVAAVETLTDAISALETRARTGHFPVQQTIPGGREPDEAGFCGDFNEARGQDRYKRALEIAAAGGHNLLAFGVPGAGKTMLARRFPGILTPLTVEESVEATRIHSLAGALGSSSPLICLPPFRSPHHSASAEGMLGGGRGIRPGEISLAHLGVLFLDEAPEFRSNVLRALREPVEDGVITIARAEGNARLPADFQLILAANPCPCGRLGKEKGACFCSSDEVARHWRRLGAALLDRIDLRVPLSPTPDVRPAVEPSENESSRVIASRVRKAIETQRERYRGLSVRRNARLGPGLIEQVCALDESAASAFSTACDRLGFSGRARHAVLRVALTIADLDGAERIARDHVLEAVQHRRYGDDPFDVFSASEV
ncbi:MAG: YifB family Mg chelatase-like AAA ATPase [Treponemataceae bacterium]